jgi:hypothetical protein
MAYIKKYLKTLTPLVPEERQATFKKDVEGAVKFLLSKLSDFQLYVWGYTLPLLWFSQGLSVLSILLALFVKILGITFFSLQVHCELWIENLFAFDRLYL